VLFHVERLELLRPLSDLPPSEREDWDRFAGWKEIFDRFPLPHAPGYHTFRARYRWNQVPRGTHGLIPDWKAADLREGRVDPCEGRV
jgi:hypothetical protein